MGSVFKNPTIPRAHTQRPFVNARRAKYLHEKKTDRAPNEQRELNEQLAFCAWLKSAVPNVHFRADTSAGDWNSKHIKNRDTLQRSAKGLPDITIYAARHGYHSLLIEFKATGEELKMKRDGRTIRVRKDKRGKVIESDYKIRKIGDWKDLHTERQHNRHVELQADGFLSVFAVGLEQAKEITCRYFDLPYEKPAETAELF